MPARHIICLLSSLWIGMTSFPAAAQSRESIPAADYKGSKDHPMISRFEGAVIIGYLTKDYDELAVPLGRYVRYDADVGKRFEKVKLVEGKITRIAYGIPQPKSTLEIYRNYEQALKQAGFETLFACVDNACGRQFDFVRAVREGMMRSGSAYDNKVNWIIGANNSELRHVSALLRRPQGDVHVAISVMQNKAQHPGVLVQLVEKKSMQTDQVTVDSNAIGKAMAAQGRIALYGITFDTDSAVIRPESKATLDEMAKYLKANTTTKIHVVGHTDNTGSLAHNDSLSQQRAESVVASLVKDHGIAPQRLSAKGLASYAPVASNQAEAGRARNRRVELVEQ